MYFIEQNVARSAWGRVAGSVEAVGGAKSKSNGKTRYLVVTGDPYELIHVASLLRTVATLELFSVVRASGCQLYKSFNNKLGK